MADFEGVSIERVRDFWDSRPCNLGHSPLEVGTREYFDAVEARKYFVEPHILRFAEFKRWQDKRVLEIGCGIGTDTVNFARCGGRVTAVELSNKSLGIARQRARVYGLESRIQFYCGDAEELNRFVPIEPYDLIYSFGVIHHSPHPGCIIAQIRQYMHPGSIVKIMVYHSFSWKALWILLAYGQGRFWQFRDLVARYSEAQTGCPVTYTFTPRQVNRILGRFGLKVTQMQVEHIFPYRIPDYRQYRYIKLWYFRWMPPAVFRWLERHFGWHLCLTAKLQ